MRNVLWCTVLAVALVGMAPGTALAQDPCLNCVRTAVLGDAWCEDFEETGDPGLDCVPNGYETENCTVQPEIIPGCNNNYGWWNDNDVLGVINCEQNHTEGGEQSLALDADDDTVHFFGDGYDLATSEFWQLIQWVYVPCNMDGDAYWIVNPDYEINGDPGSTTWSIQVKMTAGDLSVTDDCGGESTDLLCNQWVELRAEINFAADKVRLFYNDQFLSQYQWSETPGCGGTPSLSVRGMDWFNAAGTRFYYDDSSMCAADVPRFTTPDLQCRAIERLDSGCADYWWSLANVNEFDDIVEFYVDVEAGDGGNICGGEEDMTPPPGWTVTLCSGYTNGHALFRLVNDDPKGNPFVPGQSVKGRLRVDPNGASPTVTDTGLEVPPFSALLHVAQVSEDGASNPEASCDGTFDWGPTTEHPVSCVNNDDCVEFGVDCVDGFCENVFRRNVWSSPTDVCTAFLAVPAMTTWAKAALVTLLVAGGALLVLRSRRPVTA
ncbi:MAG: hypothetical protein IID39_08155 [Planctomycetes bacterium]|nr:hypothetical protein [Planctomycetota bacterium]